MFSTILVQVAVLFGCSDDMTVCERLEQPRAEYVSFEACTRAHDALLRTETALSADYPTTVALCLAPDQMRLMKTDQVDLMKFTKREIASR